MNLSALAPIHSEEAERALLGAILSQPVEVIERAIEAITPEDFFNPAYGILFRGLVDMHKTGLAIDLSTVMQYLDDRKLSDETGGPALLGDLAAGVVSVMTAPAHIKTIRAKSSLRALQKAAIKTIVDTVDRQHDPENVIEAAKQRISCVQSGKEIDSDRLAEMLAARKFSDEKEVERPTPVFEIGNNLIGSPGKPCRRLHPAPGLGLPVVAGYFFATGAKLHVMQFKLLE